MNPPLHFIVNDIPYEWRVVIDKLEQPTRAIPDLPNKTINSENLPSILNQDPTLQNIPITLDKTQLLLHSASILEKEINDCCVTLETAEKRRREIASNAELIHGECDSQISAEQKLTIFVKSIDSILHYFDDLNSLNLDFKSPLFSVLSPDFPINLQKIEKGIQFFQMNQNYRDSQSYLLQYQALQAKSIEIIKNYVSTTFSKITSRLSSNSTLKIDENIYVKFISVAPIIRRLFVLTEKTSSFSNILSIYKISRIHLLTPILSQPISDITEIRSKASTVLTVSRKEFELAKEFFNFDGHPLYVKTFCELIHEIGCLYHDSCFPIIMQNNDIKSLCNTCIVLKGDVLQEEINRIPIATEKLRFQIMRVLQESQERLIHRSELRSLEIKGDTDKTIELLSLLYYALPRDMFSSCAFKLIKNSLKALDEIAQKQFVIVQNDPKSSALKIEKDAFLLGNYLLLHDRIKNFDCQIVGNQSTQTFDYEPVSEFLWRVLRFNLNFLKTISDNTNANELPQIDCRQELEKCTSATFQSLTNNVTDILFEKVSKMDNKTSKSEILSLIRSCVASFDEKIKDEVLNVIVNRIKSKNYRDAVVGVLKAHLKQVIENVMKNLTDIDAQTTIEFTKLLNKIDKLAI